jgi:hypothetical protein
LLPLMAYWLSVRSLWSWVSATSTTTSLHKLQWESAVSLHISQHCSCWWPSIVGNNSITIDHDGFYYKWVISKQLGGVVGWASLMQHIFLRLYFVILPCLWIYAWQATYRFYSLVDDASACTYSAAISFTCTSTRDIVI